MNKIITPTMVLLLFSGCAVSHTGKVKQDMACEGRGGVKKYTFLDLNNVLCRDNTKVYIWYTIDGAIITEVK
jgi:hypothetical protein